MPQWGKEFLSAEQLKLMESQLGEASELIVNTQYLFQRIFQQLQITLSDNDTSDQDTILANILGITTWDPTSGVALDNDINLSTVDRLKLITFREWERNEMLKILNESKL